MGETEWENALLILESCIESPLLNGKRRISVCLNIRGSCGFSYDWCSVGKCLGKIEWSRSGVTASMTDSRKLEPAAIAVFHHGDVGTRDVFTGEDTIF